MLRHLILFAATLSSQASPWSEIFNPQNNWQAAQGVTAMEKNLTILPGHDPKIFTNATDPKKS
ncbi:hypothetical protein N9A86_05445, partial [Akkermansiaceae bacterium]|nr:hypothetical protein [Akkermansiaceae bacterium]